MNTNKSDPISMVDARSPVTTASNLTNQGKSIVAKDELKRWMTPQPIRPIRDLFLDWLGIVLALLAVTWMPTWWMYSIAFIVVGCCQYALFILGHDAIHSSLHPNRLLNDRLAKWAIHGPMFMALEDGRRSHLEHHRTLGTASDPDRYLHTLSNKNSRIKFLLFCSGLATFGKTVLKVTPFGKLLNSSRPIATEAYQSKNLLTPVAPMLLDYTKQRVPVLVTQTLLISIFAFSTLPLWSYLVLWVAPIYFCVFLPDEIRAFCDHAVPVLPDSKADSSRLVTFRPSWIEGILFSPHNMNYHAEHHLYPGVPYYNLPIVHQVLKDRAEVTVRGSYLIFLFHVIRLLPLQDSAEAAS
ncbi:fatty acid desaturase family protein [Microcoleus sp. FACHB-831]|uniref:fatty acid desaturase family protein n=1 Tax=Microcoleus sp. FACHB-831 TaxID=2692827 RepID=UPI0016837F26|nr:fatty acid desaturase family protein [Microcoleus sp. FACHB-831]MBD1923535.1 fatty acid desaturase family protein [Microcoleus sp. FACHB-831]